MLVLFFFKGTDLLEILKNVLRRFIKEDIIAGVMCLHLDVLMRKKL